ncbi:hypothetical protein ACJIZ3_006026 [Penstemon smallii]|uniref:Transmembrane protein n=1 Tax=Penstemon smallii TaxID=265156 RepID=A0ABD3S6P3_9LAMI
MGSQLFQFFNPFSIPISHNYSPNFSINNNKTISPIFYGDVRWDWIANVNPNQRSRFRDAYVTDDYDEEDEFWFRNTAKQRVWWSNDFYEDDDDDEEFGFELGSISFHWILKVFRAFGWMIPAVVMSLLLGTGPNAIIMTLALPLAQSALSLVTDTLWGRSSESEGPRPRTKSKKRPFSRAKTNTRARKEKGNRTQSGDYKSWVAANNEKGGSRNFGGWDELDGHMRVNNAAQGVKNANESRVEEERVQISRRTKGDTPLLVRLLIATFPFLGFWTKLL